MRSWKRTWTPNPTAWARGFRDALYAQTGGHALFTVETLHNLQECGELFKDEAGRWVAHESLDWGELPVRVEAAIAERIARLPEAYRRLLSAASVQGDDFTGELMAELTGQPVDEVLAALSGSLSRQHTLVKAQGVAPPEGLSHPCREKRSVYRFRHHLFQKYLYGELDAVERVRWHAGVAASLEQQIGISTAERERFAGQLAWHYESAGMPAQAAAALLDAGRQAVRVSAFREALSLFDHGLELLHAASAEPAGAGAPAERANLEQLLQIARLVPQRTLGGSGAKELEGALAQVMETGVDDMQDRTKLVALSSECDYMIGRGQLSEVLALSQRILDLAVQCGDAAFEALAHFWFGFAYHLLGEPQQADGYLEWILARCTPGCWAELRTRVGFDLLPHALTISAINRLSLGYLDAACERSARAVAAARELGDQYGLAFASAVGSMTLYLLRGDLHALQERAELCFRHCERHGFAWWQYYAGAFLGWLAVVRGEPEAGIERMHDVIAAWQATGMLLGADSLGILLADAYLPRDPCPRRWRRPPGLRVVRTVDYGRAGADRRGAGARLPVRALLRGGTAPRARRAAAGA